MKIFIFITTLFSGFLFGQEITVKFRFNKNLSYDFASETKKFTLHQNNDLSIFKLDDITDTDNFKYGKEVNILKKADTLSAYTINNTAILFLFNEITFKDFKTNEQTSTHAISNNFQFVKDKINMFDWELLNEKDTLIANYSCKKAITKFRGRDYIAYYTNQIANQGGPWKFDGLPGFILKVKSKDNFISIEPTEVILNNKISQKFLNPFIGKKVIEFEQVAAKFLENEKRQVARARSRPNPPDKSVFGIPESIEDIGINKERVYE